MGGRSDLGRLKVQFEKIPQGLWTAACAVFLFAMNAVLCRGLFRVEFTERLESIESSYMSISRWMLNHWGHLDWFPLWYGGVPFHRVYQPGFHAAVAATAALFHFTIQHAYHLLTATEYCLGPVTLFWLCYDATGRRGAALTAGVLYSLVSPASMLVPGIRADTDNLITARRFIILVRYGEGPHTTAVMMLPLLILLIHFTVSERRWWGVIVAPLGLAAIVLTNWPGTVGFCLAMAAYLVSRIGCEKPIDWIRLLGVAGVAYLLACPWVPPSILRAVQENAQRSDATTLGHGQLFALLEMGVVFLILHIGFERFETARWVRFFLYFTLITGAVAIGREWFGWRLLPQPNRFQVEFELAVSGLAAVAGAVFFHRWPRFVQLGIMGGLALVCGYEAVRFRKFAAAQIRPIDMSRTLEYKMATWFDHNLHGGRAFAPGNVSLWMNMFTDTPQVAGCCDQSIPNHEYRVANYVIYTGQNAGGRDAEISILWLKAYGADAIGVTGPKSAEYFHPYWNSRKFEGVLPVLWRDSDSAVYSVQRRNKSLAHVVNTAQLVGRAPIHGLDVGPLEPYVSAIEARNAPFAEIRWSGYSKARIEADLHAGDLVSVQVSHDRGWRAEVNGSSRRVFSDAIGLIVVDPQCVGRCTIDLTWDGGTEARWMRWLQRLGLLLWVLWGFAAGTGRVRPDSRKKDLLGASRMAPR